jgi:hypothetical protein
MRTKVWVVMRNDYEDSTVEGVFSNESEAKKYADFRNGIATKRYYGGDSYEVEEHDFVDTCREMIVELKAKIRRSKIARIEREKQDALEAERKEAERQAYLKEFPPVEPEDLEKLETALEKNGVVEYHLHRHVKGLQVLTKRPIPPTRERRIRTWLREDGPKVEFAQI